MSIEAAALPQTPVEYPVDGASTSLAPCKPNFLETAYGNVGDGWTRAFPWTLSSTKSDCYSTIYTRPNGGGQRVRVHVRRSYIRDCSAAIFEITHQLRKELQAKRSTRFRRRKRG
ncbi:hypothetical protein [Bradyrhizobium sp. BR 1433]|uniref:hypothetical protein n=1 Tax=Bradyrhizobium sp. BR 1433 TaxID=3447967 RepID=UPI003EE7A191